MKVWLVIVSDCESSGVVAVCSTKILAERELFKKRDELVKGWKEMLDFAKDRGADDMYQNMIKNLSSDDYEKWDNYPQEVVSISEVEVIEGKDGGG